MLTFSNSADKKSEALLLPFYQGKRAASFDFPLPKQALIDFKGKNGETLLLYPENLTEKRVILVGLGNAPTGEEVRRGFAAAVQACHKLSIQNCALLLPDQRDHFSEIIEGILLASHKKSLSHVALLHATKEEMKRANEISSVIEGVYLARDLVNQSADQMLPKDLAHAAKSIPSVQTTVWDKKRIEKEGLHLLLTVARGAASDPVFIISRYVGNKKSKDHTVIVGKGVTYDTGGLNLKSDMSTMRCDMAGAAAAIGLLHALTKTKSKANVTVVIPACENAIGARSYKPGDVYTSYSGKKIEIGNTDAEGRLILADALSYACRHLKPTRIIDMATLTGAMLIALGREITGVMCNDDSLFQKLEKAGQKSYERIWRLPLLAEYKDKLKSDCADLCNVGGRDAGSIKAALFLQEFVGDIPWAHLDIAGTAFATEAKGYLPKQGSGVGVRLLYEYFTCQ